MHMDSVVTVEGVLVGWGGWWWGMGGSGGSNGEWVVECCVNTVAVLPVCTLSHCDPAQDKRECL